MSWVTSGFDRASITKIDYDTFRFNSFKSFQGDSWTYSLSSRIALLSVGDANLDYGNTSRVAFSLPTNVTYTSQSGVFLSAAAGAVPEPEMWALLVLGFALVGGAMRASGKRRMLSQAHWAH